MRFALKYATQPKNKKCAKNRNQTISRADFSLINKNCRTLSFKTTFKLDDSFGSIQSFCNTIYAQAFGYRINNLEFN